MDIIRSLLNSFVFWAAWIIIPIIMEIIPAFGSLFILLKRRIVGHKNEKKMTIFPEISLIIPVYNSEDSLGECIRSISDSTYPNSKMRVFLVNNQGKDNSFGVFTKCQELYPDLMMQWMNAEQGKSRALNLALYNSEGKYIIHIDSDGVLEPSALENMVTHFENDLTVNCMTGAVLTRPDMVQKYKFGISRLFRKLEFVEYAQAFLAGRNYASETNSVYTLSGAFSGFRKSAILNSWLYSTDTICEDTHITFQMKYMQNEKVKISEDAIFFVDPIEDADRLYTQRQRWQRGSLEVSKMFMEKKLNPAKMFTDVNVRTLMYDHTFAFPRLIWYLALICLTYIGYSGKTVLFSMGIVFAFYIVSGYLYYFSILGFLKKFKELHDYYRRQWWVIALLPFFNFIVFFIRLAGIINGIGSESSWKTKTLHEEREEFDNVLRKDSRVFVKRIRKIRDRINYSPVEMRRRRERNTQSIGWYIVIGVVFLIAAALAAVCRWVTLTYGVSLNDLIITMKSPLKGTGHDVIYAALRSCLPIVFGCIALFVALATVCIKIQKKSRANEAEGKKSGRLGKILFSALAWCSVCSVFATAVYANNCFDIVGYLSTRGSASSIYETYYVDPLTVAISRSEEPKNLIYLYVESLETTYASTDVGGYQPMNYMPNLTQLAQENISFSEDDKLGGFHSTYGTGVTMGALFGTTTGVPYDWPGDINSDANQGSFASGITALGDVLESMGYNQEFLCGSDGTFAGRATYFTQHGNYNIFDYFTAIEKGYIAPDYKVWWGYEDEILFKIAKDEALRLSKEDKPFNLTFLTVDMHHIDGYMCNICHNDYSNVTANVVSCVDRQIKDFIDWCKKQPFFDDTVIVITGDHPRMDTSLVEGVEYYDRTVYNCFINAPANENTVTKNREFTPLDIFPSVLSAMGFNIEGDRLGLGTDLFSGTPTLAEENGFEWLNSELSKRSNYYLANFAPELN